jgi:hypothetical protein
MRSLATMAAVGWMALAAAAGLGSDAPPAAKDTAAERVAGLQAALEAGRLDEVVAGAASVLRGVRDEGLKTEATRLLAEALRRKGDWRPAAKAYKDLAARFEKGSDAAVRHEAVAEVLEAAPQGLYHALQGDKDFGPPKTLADEAVLAAALDKLAEQRAAKLAARVAAMRVARTPPDVVSIFEELAAAYREIRAISPGFPYDAERRAAQAAAERLETIGRDLQPKVRAKIVEADREVAQRGTVTSAQREEFEEYHATCAKMAEAEEAFRRTLQTVGGAGWPERGRLGLQSAGRGAAYGLAAARFHWLSVRPTGRRLRG